MKYLNGCLVSQEVDKGLSVVDREFAVRPYSSQRAFESEIRRLYGELLATQGEHNDELAEQQMRLAIDIARRQEAKSLELRAVVSQTRLWQRRGGIDEARQSLAECYDWFTEGFDTADLVDARRLLQELG